MSEQRNTSQLGDSNPGRSFADRILAGAVAGVVFASFALLIVFWSGQPVRSAKLPWIGALVVGVVTAVAIIEVPIGFRRFAIGFLLGNLIGGLLVFSPVLAAIDFSDTTASYNRMYLIFQGIATSHGTLIAGIFGLVMGVVMWLNDRRVRTMKRP